MPDAAKKLLTFSPLDHDLIVTPDEQELLASVKVIMEKLPSFLADWSLDFSAVVGDYTGGRRLHRWYQNHVGISGTCAFR